MPLFWIVHTIDGEPSVFLQEHSNPMYAAMKALQTGKGGQIKEVIKLDEAKAKRVPHEMIGRWLDQLDTAALLLKLQG